ADGLVVRGVDVQLARGAGDLRQARIAVDHHVVAHPVFRLAGVLDLGLELRGDVLDERPARGDVHDLHAQTDAEGREAKLAGRFGEGEVVLLPPDVHGRAARMP